MATSTGPIQAIAPRLGRMTDRQSVRRTPPPPTPVALWETEELQRWLRRAGKQRDEWLKQLEWFRVRAEYSSNGMRQRVSRLMASPTLQWLAFYEVSGACGSERQRNEFISAHLENLGHRDERLNPALPSGEVVQRILMPKASGGFRTIYEFGPFMKARHRLVKWVMERVLGDAFFCFQAMHTGTSRRAFIDRLKETCRDPQWTHVAVGDVTNFFGSISHDYLREHLPLPTGVIENSVIHPINSEGGVRTGQSRLTQRIGASGDIGSLPHTVRPDNDHRRGIPQGPSCSPILAYPILEETIAALNPTIPIFQYGDDVVTLGRSGSEVDDLMDRLSNMLSRNPAGPLFLRRTSSNRTRDGFSFHGHRFTPSGDRVRVSLLSSRRERFFDNLRERIDADLHKHDDGFRCAMDYLDGWMAQALCDERLELFSRALTTIDGAADQL